MPTDIQRANTKRRVRVLWLVGSISVVLALLVLAATSWTVYSNWDGSRNDLNRAQSNRVYLRSLNNLLSELENAESGQRGYLLTGLDRYLEPYRRSLAPIAENSKILAGVAKERPEETAAINRILGLTQEKLQELALTIELQKQSHTNAVKEVLTDKGLIEMNEIRALGKTVAEAQRTDVTKRSADSAKHQLATIKLAAAGGFLLLCLTIAGFVTLTSGAAQQVLLAERLADSTEILKTTLTSIGDGVIATDKQALIEFINPEAAQLTGWKREDAIGKHLDEVLTLINERTRRKVDSPFAQVMRTGSATGMANHTILVRRDGTEVAIDDSGAPIRNTEGKIRGVVLVFRDIEQRRKAEAALQLSHNELLKANEELRQFSYAATHDLQEPLRTIVVFSQLLARNYKSTLDERGHHLLQTVEDAGHRMSSLINDLLSFTRIGGLDSPGTLMRVNASEILGDTLVQLNGAIEETKAAVHHRELPDVWSEPAQLSQLFQNLISNAIKYRKPDVPPVIHVSATIEGDRARFQVRDNGIGFKQEYSERIFLLFQRLHGRSIPGTGIGLALCRRIIERQGGRIWATSEENVGSSFYFTLPLAQSEVAAAKQLLPQ